MSSEGIYTAVIVETRVTDLFELVLDNFYNRLDKRWNFMIFCSLNNKDFLINLIREKFLSNAKRTTLVVLHIDKHISIDLHTRWFVDYDYSKLLTDEKFYKLIPTEIHLIFQLDTLLSDKYYDKIYDFMEYDYVGAPWDLNKKGANGGLSLRRTSKMIEVIKDKSFEQNKPNFFYHEDGYFCGHPNLNIPIGEISKKFSVETCYYDKPVGMHKAFRYITPEQLNELETHFPKIKELYMRWIQLSNETPISPINEDLSYKTNFFDKYEFITFVGQ
jgi:hypothetical protein